MNDEHPTGLAAIQINLPATEAQLRSLRAGDEVELNGDVITGRDQACARLSKLLVAGEPLPVDLVNQTLYFVGPSPAPPGRVVGSAGPTTSGRMNRFLPQLLAAGVRGVIGKGHLSVESRGALVSHGGVYFGAIGGTGALLARAIESVEVIAFPELLSEAMRRMRLRRFPVVVLADTVGNNLYERGPLAVRTPH